MPIYRYFCNDCSLEFEELRKYDDRDNSIDCPDCESANTKREFATTFGVKTTLDPKKDTIYSPKEIDKVVGAESEKKWEGYDIRWKKRYEERQKKRWGGKKPEELRMSKDTDGKYSPIMHLGKKQDRELRKDYSDALQEHRAERKKKGLGQFDGMKDRDSVVKLKPKKDSA
jgi:putative FmdB family regulatory protein